MQSSIPAMALDLWAISRMIEIEWEMCGRPGEDTLGVERISDQANPRKGKIPIPPMMDTQLDQIVIGEVLEPLKKKILGTFEAKVALNRPEDWFEIYLSSFIILNHIERLAKHSAFHARLHAMPVSCQPLHFLFSSPDNVADTLLQHAVSREGFPRSKSHSIPIPLCLQGICAAVAGLGFANHPVYGEARRRSAEFHEGDSGPDQGEG